MKLFLPVFIFSLLGFSSAAQNFKGQWKGSFIDKSSGTPGLGTDECDYVLELETTGDNVTGHSYTYYTHGGKKYYTICKLEGFVNRKSRYIEVKETERTKTNVPDNIINCFQTHKLTYTKLGDSEILEGNWIPAPRQEGNCGYGYTTLKRRVLQTASFQAANKSFSRTTIPSKRKQEVTPKTKQNNSTAIVKAPVRKDKITHVPELKKTSSGKDAPLSTLPVIIPSESRGVVTRDYMKRNINLLKTIKVGGDNIKVDMYDNGEIDGDSVSLYYNGKLLASKKRLTDRSLSFVLPVDKDVERNELVMYAENLGSIPPNTALMVVTDGIRRYEVRITSDLQKSGVIHFVHETTAGN